MTHPGSSIGNEVCPKCNHPLNADHAHRTYEEHDACRNSSGPSGEQRGERVVKCINCGEFTPGVYEAQHNEALAEMTKNRDQWERNASAENGRAGDALVKLARVLEECESLKAKLLAAEWKLARFGHGDFPDLLLAGEV